MKFEVWLPLQQSLFSGLCNAHMKQRKRGVAIGKGLGC
jgi:hypothetical protein